MGWDRWRGLDVWKGVGDDEAVGLGFSGKGDGMDDCVCMDILDMCES